MSTELTCDDAAAALSASTDGEPVEAEAREALDGHLRDCERCAGFAGHVRGLRATLRLEAVDTAADVAGSVRAVLAARTEGAAAEGRRGDDRAGPFAHRGSTRRPVLAAAAVGLLAGTVAGATAVGIGTEPRSPAAADVPARVLEAQHDITSLDARIAVVEHGRRGQPAHRTFAGTLRYAAPESLALSLHERPPDPDDTAEGPPSTGTQREGDVDLVVDGDRWWLAAGRRCSPAPGRVRCPDGPLRSVRAVTGREPFSTAAPVPLDLVTPVDSFTLAAEPRTLGERSIAGRRAVGVVVPAGQLAPFLDGLSPAGDLREVHPTDPVDVWLDAELLVPLDVVVHAGPGAGRQRWAEGRGYDDPPGEAVLRFTVGAISVNAGVPAGAFDEPARAEPSTVVDAGFTAGDAPAVPVPAGLPPSWAPYRTGTVSTSTGPTVSVRTWSDGRAWVTVRATRGWRAPHLFGDLGAHVREVGLEDAGRGYVSEDGRSIGLHADGVDIVVSGSVPVPRLREIADGLGVVGVPVPDHWREAATATLDEAVAARPGLLVAAGINGFGPPAIRMGDAAVTQVHAGPGDRTVTLVDVASHRLPPPTGDEVGVRVRGVAGRYSAERGELEWLEDGSSHSLRAPALSLEELLGIAAALEPAGAPARGAP